MSNYNDEYYFIDSVGINYPLLGFDEDEDDVRYTGGIILRETPVKLRFNRPVPKKPKMADIHSVPSPVISKKLKELLDGFSLKEVQFVPATVRNTKSNEIITDYFIINVFNLIECADLERSEFTPDESNPYGVLSFDKLVLDNEKLDKIPLEERLVFALKEEITTSVYHKSVVQKIIDSEPVGFTATSLSDWTQSTPFENEYIAWLGSDDDDDTAT
jgi:hypothetical protein